MDDGQPDARSAFSPLSAIERHPWTAILTSASIHAAFVLVAGLAPDDMSHRRLQRWEYEQVVQVLKATRGQAPPRAESDAEEGPVEPPRGLDLVAREVVEAPERSTRPQLGAPREQREAVAGPREAASSPRLAGLARSTPAKTRPGALEERYSGLSDVVLRPIPGGGEATLAGLPARLDPTLEPAPEPPLDPFGGSLGPPKQPASLREGVAAGPAGPVDELGPRTARRPELTAPDWEPRVIAQRPRVQGRDAGVIRSAVRRQLLGVRTCYRDALQADGSIEGRLDLGFTILPGGRVHGVTLSAEGTRAPAAMLECMTRRVARWRFPPRQGGAAARVRYPLILKRVPQPGLFTSHRLRPADPQR